MRIGWVLLLALIGCADEDESISVDSNERAVERRIDGSSPFWSAALVLFEGPFACPLPADAFAQPLAAAHESFVIHNAGAATSVAIWLEGSSSCGVDSHARADFPRRR